MVKKYRKTFEVTVKKYSKKRIQLNHVLIKRYAFRSLKKLRHVIKKAKI